MSRALPGPVGDGADRAGAACGARRHRVTTLLVVVGLSVGLGACGSSKPQAKPGQTSNPSSSPTTVPSSSADNQFYLDLATLDPDLSTYVNQNSQVALKAMLADGIDLCDVLYKGGDIDTAMTNVAAGAAQVEYETGLPQSVKTFNAIDSAALLALCPDVRDKLPASDQANLNQLQQQLKAAQPAGVGS